MTQFFRAVERIRNHCEFSHVDVCVEFANKNVEQKILFIKEIHEESKTANLPNEFKKKKTRYSEKNVEKIFFYMDSNGNKIRRSWLFVKNNIFFCAVCLCFKQNQNNPLSTGYNYDQPKNTLCVLLKKHEETPTHKKLVHMYLKEDRNENRQVSQN